MKCGFTAQYSKAHHRPVDCKGIEILIPVSLSDEVYDNIYTFVICLLFHDRRKVLGLVIGNSRWSVVDRVEPVNFILRRRCRDDLVTMCAHELSNTRSGSCLLTRQILEQVEWRPLQHQKHQHGRGCYHPVSNSPTRTTPETL